MQLKLVDTLGALVLVVALSEPTAAGQEPVATSQDATKESGCTPQSGGPACAKHPSITESLRRLESASWPAGLPPPSLGFDAKGADFSRWIDHFKNEVFRNWKVPKSAEMAGKRRADIALTVTRDGHVKNCKILQSSEAAALDKAAEKALKASRLLPLPSDYPEATLKMRVSFFYSGLPSEK